MRSCPNILTHFWTASSQYRFFTIQCGASDGTYGILSAWWVHSPMYAKGNVGSDRAWTLTGDFYEDGMCSFSSMICHNGMYIGIASDTLVGSGKGGIQISSNGFQWSRTMQHAYGYSENYKIGFNSLRQVGRRLFLLNRCNTSPYDSVYQLCVMNSNARSYSIVRPTCPEMPSLYVMVYVETLGQFLHFGDNVIYASPDGFRCDLIPKK